jgi:hypothetical protein
VFHLDARTVVMPFPQNFFGSPYSGDWSYPVLLPDARVASATLLVTNRYGSSATASLNLTQTTDYGLRTLSGGQYCLQVNGFLSIDNSAVPPLTIEATHAVRDVFATLGSPADGPVQVRVNLDGAPYSILTVPATRTVSDGVDGFALPLLRAGAQISLSILSVGQTYPGGDLTVTIRL